MSARGRGRGRRNLSRADRDFIDYVKDYRQTVGQNYLQELKEDDSISLLSSLSERSKRFPNAHFLCGACKYYMEEEEMEKHRKTYAHTRKIKVLREDEVLESIEAPSGEHLGALSEYLNTTYQRIRLHDAEKRRQVVEDLQVAVQQRHLLSGVNLELSGSVRDGFAIKDSDTNIRIMAAKDANYLIIFTEIHQILKGQGRRYSNILMDLESRSPFISFSTPNASGTFKLLVLDDGKHNTHIILSAYSQWHPEVQQLGCLLKHFARQAGVTDIEKGGLLPMCMPIVVIHYIQQEKLSPVLIKADELVGATDEDIQETVDKQIRNLENAMTRRPRSKWQKVLRNFQNNWSDRNIAELWLDMLRFYSLEFEFEKKCVGIITIGVTKRDTKTWQRSKRIAIEEPGSPERNLAQMVSNQQVLDYVIDSIRFCYLHFGVYEGRGRRHRFSFSIGQEMKKKFPIFCRNCHAPDHTAMQCPTSVLPECQKLPVLNHIDKKLLNDLLVNVKDDMQLTAEEERTRHKFIRTVDDLLLTAYSGARTEVFGSSKNGFGSYNSDIDVTLVCEEQEPLDRDEIEDVVEKVQGIMEEAQEIKDVNAVFDSKVPVVSFCNANLELRCDVSVNNLLAIQNTKMLLHYSQIDERVRTLGFCLKIFAKECGMADAYQRTLSSYTYILMLIFYLQRCDPPVLPVLQELYNEDCKPEKMVDGYNAWFYSGNKRDLRSRWRQPRTNKQDESELWIGFLDFYSQKFDYKKKVVSIRTAQDVTKMEKLWNSDLLAIEDPFKTDHNLAKALSAKSNARILGNLILARNVFGNPIQSLQNRKHFEYFFKHETYLLPENEPEHGRK